MDTYSLPPLGSVLRHKAEATFVEALTERTGEAADFRPTAENVATLILESRLRVDCQDSLLDLVAAASHALLYRAQQLLASRHSTLLVVRILDGAETVRASSRACAPREHFGQACRSVWTPSELICFDTLYPESVELTQSYWLSIRKVDDVYPPDTGPFKRLLADAIQRRRKLMERCRFHTVDLPAALDWSRAVRSAANNWASEHGLSRETAASWTESFAPLLRRPLSQSLTARAKANHRAPQTQQQLEARGARARLANVVQTFPRPAADDVAAHIELRRRYSAA
jgi:hypothetical protein